MTKTKFIPIRPLIKLNDDLFSIYIRLRDTDKNGVGYCTTCHTLHSFNFLQCGHYISRDKKSLRYDAKNCHIQCIRCNVFLKGNYPAYSAFMQKVYGNEILNFLNTAKHHKLTSFELIAIFNDTLKKIDLLPNKHLALSRIEKITKKFIELGGNINNKMEILT